MPTSSGIRHWNQIQVNTIKNQKTKVVVQIYKYKFAHGDNADVADDDFCDDDNDDDYADGSNQPLQLPVEAHSLYKQHPR